MEVVNAMIDKSTSRSQIQHSNINFKVKGLTNLLFSIITQSQFTKKDNVQLLGIVSFILKHFSLIEVKDLGETEKNLNSFELKFAKDRVVILQTQMTHVHLHFLIYCADLVAKLFSDL